MWTRRNKPFWLLLSLSCLLAGLSLYALLRPLPWMPWAGLSESLPLWLHQQLPDGLWAAAFASFLMYLTQGKGPYRMALLWPLLCSAMIEGLQFISLWPGTADKADIAWAGLGCLLIWMIQKWKSDDKEAAL